MSRSYRKPWVTDGYKGSKTKQYCKNQANRLIRRTKDVPNGNRYRRYYEQWNICDYKWPVNVTNKDDEFFEEDFWRYNRK